MGAGVFGDNLKLECRKKKVSRFSWEYWYIDESAFEI